MKALLFDRNGRLRNGAWVLVFIACMQLTRLAYRPLKGALQELGLDGLWLEPVPVVLVLLATWACTRMRGERLASTGLELNRRWFAEAGWGTLLGTGAMLLVAALMAAFGGVRFELDPSRGALVLATGAYVFVCAALMEELLFRGFVFQRLVAGIGAWPAQLILAALFALGHWTNPGMEGMPRLIGSIDLALGAVLLGLAWLRTRSLALPIGLHFGWNFVQGQVLGFAVSGYSQAGWFRPLLQHQPEWLSGGAVGPEASVCAVVVDLLTIVLLLCWRGTARARAEPHYRAVALPAVN